jgi:1-acyl-sn-glycerol-3-phosphate acyltransferase
MLEAAEYLDREIASSGLGKASKDTLERIGIEWESHLPKGSSEIIRSAPVIFYGNHPSMLTPFLIAAGVDRTDIHLLMMSYVGHLIPSLSRLILPLELPLNRPLLELYRGGLKRIIALWLVSRLHDVPQRTLAKAINRRSLEAAVAHVRAGGSVAIFPAGGGRANRRWYPGIGTLVKELTRSSTDRPVYLVPIREYNGSNHRVYASVAKTKAAQIRRRLLYRRPVRIEFADPIRLDGLPIDPDSSHRIAAWLKEHYDRLFPLPTTT